MRIEQPRPSMRWTLQTLTVLGALGGLLSGAGYAQVRFNSGLLAFPVDVSLFARGNPVPAGDYHLDIYVNEVWQGKHRLRFAMRDLDPHIAQPCFHAGLLERIGLDVRQIVADKQGPLLEDSAVCEPLDTLFPSLASARFDSNAQRLDIVAAQAVRVRRPRGYVDPRRWDSGITAAHLSYDYNLWHAQQAHRTQTSQYLGLHGGLNLGDWRLRYRGTLNHAERLGTTYRHSAFFVERALPALHSTLLMGESVTHSPVFDSLGFRGLRLESDERMRADSRSGFVPIVSGIAQTNARVTISQRGMPIFEATMPPGPFVIDDLSPNGSGGDLLVTITESDGTARRFTVTYATLPQMLRPGLVRYSVALGRYRDRSLGNEPWLGTGSLSMGINNTLTGYGGALLAQGYSAVSAGIGLNLPVGAVTLDATWARTALGTQASTRTGTGWRLAYNKHLTDTRTEFRLALLRYASHNYFEPAQAFRLRDTWRQASTTARDLAQSLQHRHQLSLDIHQTLPGDWGAVSLTGAVHNYGQARQRDVQYSFSYGRNLGHAQISVNLLRSRFTSGFDQGGVGARWENQFLLTLSLPLGQAAPAYYHSSVAHNPNGYSVQASVSGSMGEHQPHHYSVYASGDKNRGQGTRGSAGASLSTTTSVARLSGSLAVGANHTRQLGLSASGGVVAFKGGVVLAPELGHTFGIVQAKGAQGAHLPGVVGAQLDARGHAVVPGLQPYRENDVMLDPQGLSPDIVLLTTGQKTVPTDGAVVLLQYPTDHGYSLLTRITSADGRAIAFAAGVLDETGHTVGYVAQGQQALLRVTARQGELTVRWNTQTGESTQCRFAYDLDALPQAARSATAPPLNLRRLEALCL